MVDEIKPIFIETFNINCSLDASKKVFDILFEQLNILATINLSNSIGLDDKIILAIGIRIVIEMVFNKFDTSFVNSDLSLGEEYETVKQYLDSEDKKVFSKALISIPEFVHLNSFMYEPLIDIPTIVLQEIYKDVIKIKDKYRIE